MSGNKRLKGVVVSRPFYYGIMVKGINNEDLSYLIKKVVFKLHETYPNPLRTVEQPPFEVSETGWHTGEKQVILYHHLRLHPYEDDSMDNLGQKINQ
ncbi:unnamed protein product [Rhizopus microsporus]